VAEFLDRNPRRIKQFLSMFRLYAYICYLTGLTDQVDGVYRLTLHQLGKFLALTMKYPEINSDIERDRKLLGALEAACRGEHLEQNIKEHPTVQQWMSLGDVRKLLSSVNLKASGMENDSFERAEVSGLLSALPRARSGVNTDNQNNNIRRKQTRQYRGEYLESSKKKMK